MSVFNAVQSGHQLIADALNSDSQQSINTEVKEPSPDMPDTMTSNMEQCQQTSSSPSQDRRPSLQDLPTRPRATKSRYYAHALSYEDRQALTEGESNHNLREWTQKDMVTYRESRKELEPLGLDKLNKTPMKADVEHKKKYQQSMVSKMADKVRQFTKLPCNKVAAIDQAKKEEEESLYTQLQHGSKSMYDLRASSAPTQQFPPVSLLPPIVADQTLQEHHTHSRTVSNDEYLSRSTHPIIRAPDRPSPLHFSAPSSASSSRVRSNLSVEILPFQHNPEVTFDSFLAPHKSGKGEVFRGSENAMKPKTAKAMENLPLDGSKSSRYRLSKMPSMPAMRKRSPLHQGLQDA
ncbi:hypothetical protein BKA66DRAFT_567832 [Pyrenochaeta sp. MPI-SDFR-AT-0127]|nr:hypothetical protein BKA66DRAFT_567832 [Pyrenochaeta sp. MPI-SDFR-AT-0127]